MIFLFEERTFFLKIMRVNFNGITVATRQVSNNSFFESENRDFLQRHIGMRVGANFSNDVIF